jgi:GTPase SAR1 family protein
MYYRSANVIMICIDLSRQYDETRIDYWLERINTHADVSKCITLLVGTKADIACADFAETEDVIAMNPATAHYDTMTVPVVLKRICAQHSMIYKATSAMSGEGVKELFSYAALSIIRMISHNEDVEIVDVTDDNGDGWRDWLWRRIPSC